MLSIDTIDGVDRQAPGPKPGATKEAITMSIILASIQLTCFAALASIALIVAIRSTDDKDE